jgi:very-short-patch-repair endonuclease
MPNTIQRLSLPKAGSQGEEEFFLHCRIYKLTPEREYQFDSSRKWRIDFAFPDRKLAVEIESSVHRIKGRFASDIPKYNALQKAGWTLLRYTAQMVHAGTAIDDVCEILNGQN